MNKFLALIKPLRFKILGFMALLLGATLCELALPFIMSSIVNNGINAQNFDVVWQLSLVMLAAATVSFILMLFGTRISTSISTGFAQTARTAVYNHAMLMPLSEFGKIGTGALITRSTQDINMLQDFLAMLMTAVVTIPVFIIGGSVLAFLNDPFLALIIIVFAPLIIVLTFVVGKRLMPLYKKSHEYIDKQNTIVRERLSGIRVIRAFNKEDREHERMKEATEVMADNIIKANVSFGMLTPISLFIINAVTVLILYISSVRIGAEGANILVGDIIAIIQYVGLIMNAIFSSAMLIMFLPRLKVSVTRINDVLSTPVIAENGEAPRLLEGSIVCKDLSFCHPGAEKPALSGISLEIHKGEKVAFIGGTGSGKTTMLMLIAGLHQKTSGVLSLDGQDYDSLTIDDISRNISTVFQKHDIFSGTIRDNLDPSGVYSDDELMSALEVSQLDGFVKEMGFNYALNQGGSNLSGGQKQRLSIARALLKHNAEVFVFDDSFSALDYLTEKKLRTRLRTRIGEKTMIISTQRVATAKNCQKIFVFDCGTIIGAGTHDELMKDCGIYREIYISQSGGQL